MRLVFILRNHIKNRIGGSEYQAFLLQKYLEKKFSHEINYIHEDINYRNKKYLLKDHGSSKYSVLNYFKLKQYLKEIKPDIIYHRCKNIYSIFSGYLSKKVNSKFVYHFANDNDFSYTKNNLSSYLMYRSLQKSNAIIAQTRTQLNRLDEYKGRKYQLYNSIETDKEPMLEKENSIVWIGNIKPIKCLEKLYPIAKSLLNTKIKFYIIGRMNESQYSRKNLEIINKTPNIQYLGHKRIDEVNAILRKSKFLINTSRSEGFPNTFLQSWNNYVPCISLNIDPDSIIKDNGLGIVSEDQDVIKDYILRLIEDNNKYIKISKKAKQYVLDNHDININIVKLDHMFKELFDNKKNL
jgi:glycosyltransferase involved in cell wall biosynthesis